MQDRLYTLSTLCQSRISRYDHEPWTYREVPFLRLRGKWLEELGFERGGKVRVRAQRGRLVIEPMGGEGEG
jgi:hypothetical protein